VEHDLRIAARKSSKARKVGRSGVCLEYRKT